MSFVSDINAICIGCTIFFIMNFMLIDVHFLNGFHDILFPDFFRPVKYEYAVYVRVYVRINISHTLERLLFIFIYQD